MLQDYFFFYSLPPVHLYLLSGAMTMPGLCFTPRPRESFVKRDRKVWDSLPERGINKRGQIRICKRVRGQED